MKLGSQGPIFHLPETYSKNQNPTGTLTKHFIKTKNGYCILLCLNDRTELTPKFNSSLPKGLITVFHSIHHLQKGLESNFKRPFNTYSQKFKNVDLISHLYLGEDFINSRK